MEDALSSFPVRCFPSRAKRDGSSRGAPDCRWPEFCRRAGSAADPLTSSYPLDTASITSPCLCCSGTAMAAAHCVTVMQACTWTSGCSIPGCNATCVANVFQRPDTLYKPKNPYNLVSIQQSPVPTVPGAPVGQGSSRFPIMRDTLAVDAYRCPIVAATILEIARSINANISATEGLSAPGLVCPIPNSPHAPDLDTSDNVITTLSDISQLLHTHTLLHGFTITHVSTHA